jgi:hypothetical protein
MLHDAKTIFYTFSVVPSIIIDNSKNMLYHYDTELQMFSLKNFPNVNPIGTNKNKLLEAHFLLQTCILQFPIYFDKFKKSTKL